jgi:hypothetical protein
MLPHPDFEKVSKAPRCCLIFACRLGMAILKDAILSIVIAIVAMIGAKGLGWVWYILGLLWFGQ